MTITCSSENPKPLKEGKLDLIGAIKPIVPAFHLLLSVGTQRARLFDMVTQQIKQVMILISCFVYPGEMIDSQNIDLDFISRWYLNVQGLRCHTSKHMLHPENFMTASKYFESWRDAR